MARKSRYPRLRQFIKDYFPDSDTRQTDIRDWLRENVPAWDYIGKKDQKNILDDWRDFIKPEFVEKEIEKVEVVWKEAKQAWKDIKREYGVESVFGKIKGWFKRLF